MRRAISFFRVGDDNPLNGWHVLGIVGLFFGTIIGVNIVMAAYATGTFPGLVVHNSYVASQGYNDLLADSREQARRGWTAELSEIGGILHLRMADSMDAPLAGLRVAARVGRPASSRDDRMLDFTPTADGYASTEPLEAGRWVIELEVYSGGDLAYRQTETLSVRGPGA